MVRANNDGQVVMRGNILWQDRKPTQEEMALIDSAKKDEMLIAGLDASKAIGIEFEGVMCSATSADQSGLVAVLLAIQMQGAKFRPTVFRFANGSDLVISLINYQSFMATWLPFRQSFFLDAAN